MNRVPIISICQLALIGHTILLIPIAIHLKEGPSQRSTAHTYARMVAFNCLPRVGVGPQFLGPRNAYPPHSYLL